MKIFVINLESATERRAQAEKQLGGLGVPFEIYPARTPETSADYWARVRKFRYMVHMNRGPLPTEIACYASHQEMWKICEQLQEPIIVLEDDFELQPSFKSMLPVLDEWAKIADFVRLEPGGKRAETIVRDTSLGHELHVNLKYPFRMTGYMLTPAAASRLIKSSKKIIAPVDGFLKHFWRHGVVLHSCRPHLLNPLDLPTTIIGRSGRKPLKRAMWPFRRVYRGVNDVRKYLFNRKVRKQIAKP